MKRRFCSQFLRLNSTVIHQDNNALIIDPGVFPFEVEKISIYLEKQNLKNITILLTHTHGDHISGWNFLPRLETFGHESIENKSEAVRKNDLRYLKGIFRKQSIKNLDQLIFPNNIQYFPTGKKFGKLPYSFIFFHTPGHSTDSSSIVIPDEKLILSGDMLIQIQVPYILHSTRQYWDSLKCIKMLIFDFDLQCLIPGHGKPAKSQEEILLRIENEQIYLQKLVWEGLKLLRTGMDEKEILNQLIHNIPIPLHQHRLNVHTFLREIDIWASDEELDLNL
jgi:glyoxylase-like metal-dependent hydrolase (beta-lactamase superfamily II)